MKRFRLSKYSPAMRDSDGRFMGEDWTGCSDIGLQFNGQILSIDAYLHVESAYVQAVLTMMNLASIEELCVSELEVQNSPLAIPTSFDDGVFEFCSALHNGEVVRGEDVEKILRGGLREIVWCKLQSGPDAYIHFGYDFYLYVGMRILEATLPLPDLIFLEECPSPYEE